jgi:hypothetical protein
MVARLQDRQMGESHPGAGRVQSFPARPDIASPAGPEDEPAIDSHRWTGEVEAQKREGRTFLVLLILAVAIGAPFAVWLSLSLSRILFS